MISRQKSELHILVTLSITLVVALDPKTSVFLRVAYEGAKTYNMPRDAEKLLPACSA